ANFLRCRMRRHRINRNFTKPEAIQPLIFFPSSFEQVVKALNIPPEEYESSLFHCSFEKLGYSRLHSQTASSVTLPPSRCIIWYPIRFILWAPVDALLEDSARGFIQQANSERASCSRR